MVVVAGMKVTRIIYKILVEKPLGNLSLLSFKSGGKEGRNVKIKFRFHNMDWVEVSHGKIQLLGFVVIVVKLALLNTCD
jgi:hypothetical protein